jgi:uncharacterized membrane protein
MQRSRPSARSMVILYFGGFVLLWSAVAAGLIAGRDLAAPDSLLPSGGAHPWLVPGIVALALHAALVVVLAWKAQRWFFAHGPFAVALAGGPLIALIDNLWFVPAFLYVIAVLHLWLACLHERQGKLQSSRRARARNGAQGSATPPRNPGPPAPAGGSRA